MGDPGNSIFVSPFFQDHSCSPLPSYLLVSSMQDTPVVPPAHAATYGGQCGATRGARPSARSEANGFRPNSEMQRRSPDDNWWMCATSSSAVTLCLCRWPISRIQPVGVGEDTQGETTGRAAARRPYLRACSHVCLLVWRRRLLVCVSTVCRVLSALLSSSSRSSCSQPWQM